MVYIYLCKDMQRGGFEDVAQLTDRRRQVEVQQKRQKEKKEMLEEMKKMRKGQGGNKDNILDKRDSKGKVGGGRKEQKVWVPWKEERCEEE